MTIFIIYIYIHVSYVYIHIHVVTIFGINIFMIEETISCTIKCKENILISLVLFFIFIVSIDIQIIQFTSLPFFYPLRSFVLGLPSCDLSFWEDPNQWDFTGFHGVQCGFHQCGDTMGCNWDILGAKN